MKYPILFLLVFTLLSTLFFVLVARAAVVELKYLWVEKRGKRAGRYSAFDDYD